MKFILTESQYKAIEKIATKEEMKFVKNNFIVSKPIPNMKVEDIKELEWKSY